jgi:hypothetical protein
MQSFSDLVSGAWPFSSSPEEPSPTSSSSSSVWPFSTSHEEKKQEYGSAGRQSPKMSFSSRGLAIEHETKYDSLLDGERRIGSLTAAQSVSNQTAKRGSSGRLKPPRLTHRPGSQTSLVSSSDGAPTKSDAGQMNPPLPAALSNNLSSGALLDWSFEDSFMSMTVGTGDDNLGSTTNVAKIPAPCPMLVAPSLPDLARLTFASRLKSELDPTSQKFLQLKHAQHIAATNESYCPALVQEYNEYYDDSRSTEGDSSVAFETFQEGERDCFHEHLSNYDLFQVADLTDAGDDMLALLPTSKKSRYSTTPQSSISDSYVLSKYAAAGPMAATTSTPSPSVILSSVTNKSQEMMNDFHKQCAESARSVLGPISSTVSSPARMAATTLTPSSSAILSSMTNKSQQLMNDFHKQCAKSARSVLRPISSTVSSPARISTLAEEADQTLNEPEQSFVSETTCEVSDILHATVLPILDDICTCEEVFALGSKQRRNSQLLPTFEKLVACEKLVPDVFFDPDFDMANPITYTAVMEVLEAFQANQKTAEDDTDMTPPPNLRTGRPGGKRKKKQMAELILVLSQANSPLHEFWDVAEEALREQVSKRGKDYFAENAMFRELEVDTAFSSAEIKYLQRDMALLREISVNDPQSVPRMARERQCVQQISSLLNKVSELFSEKEKIQLLLKSQSYQEALQETSAFHQELANIYLCEKTEKPYDLARLISLDKLRVEILGYETRAFEGLSNRVVELFISWPESVCAIDTSNGNQTQQNAAAKTPLVKCEIDPEARQYVISLLNTLQNAGVLPLLNRGYTARLKEMLYVTVKATVTECAADSSDVICASEKALAGNHVIGTSSDRHGEIDTRSLVKLNATSNSVAAGIMTMTFDEFLNCLSILFEEVLGVLSIAADVASFLADERFSIAGDVAVGDPTAVQQIDFTALRSASDLSQSLVSELFDMRSKSLASISVTNMKRFYDLSSSHAVKLGKLIGTCPSAFLSAVSAQVRAYFDSRHVSQLAELSAALDDEKWVSETLSSEQQSLVSQFIPNDLCRASSDSNADGRRIRHPLLVASSLLLLEFVQWNIDCTTTFPEFSRSLTKKAAKILHLFHSRSMKLIVGAGALRSRAHLSAITISNLTVSLSSVDFVLTAAPTILSQLTGQLANEQSGASRQALSYARKEFDKLTGEYEVHISKILDKMLAVVKGLVQQTSSTLLQEVDFDARANQFASPELEASGLKVCAFFEGVYSNVVSVHKTTHGKVAEPLFRRLFIQLFEYLDQELPVTLVMAATSHSPEIANRKEQGKTNVARRRSSTISDSHSPPSSSLMEAQILDAKEATQAEKVLLATPHCFSLPNTRGGKHRMIVELVWLTTKLNQLDGVDPHSFTLATVLGRKLGILKRSGRKSAGKAKSKSKKKGKNAEPTDNDSDSETISTTTSVDSLPRNLVSTTPGSQDLNTSLDADNASVSHDSISDVGSIMSASSGLCFNGEEELF